MTSFDITPEQIAKVRQALTLGLSRQPLALFGALDAAARGSDREPALTALALIGQRQRFVRTAIATAETPAPAEFLHADPRPILNERARNALRRLINGLEKANAGLITAAAMRRVNAAGVRPHPFDLPDLLPMLRHDPSVLGQAERAFEALTAPPDAKDSVEQQSFSHAAMTTANWTSFGKATRAAFLRRERANDAVAARELLEAVFKSEPATVRGELLAALDVGLSADDLPFLESLSTDRAESVRVLAQSLIARMVGTPQHQERLARVAACFVKPSGMSKVMAAVGIAAALKFEPPKPNMPWTERMALFEGLSLDDVARAVGVSTDDVLGALDHENAFIENAFLATAARQADSGAVAALDTFIARKFDPLSAAPFPRIYEINQMASAVQRGMSLDLATDLFASRRWRDFVATFQTMTKDDGSLTIIASMTPPEALPRFLETLADLNSGATRSPKNFADLVDALARPNSNHA